MCSETDFMGQWGNGSKLLHLPTVGAKAADPPSPPPYNQPDRKISDFFTTALYVSREW